MSCGCSKIKYNVGDVINNRKIINNNGSEYHLKDKNHHNHYYRCKCLFCGREYDALGQTLEKSLSCGCLSEKSIGEK